MSEQVTKTDDTQNDVAEPAMREMTAEERRKAIRDASFNKKPDAKIVQVFGQDVEIRPLHRADMKAIQSGANLESIQDGKFDTEDLQMICACAYVPGTDIKIFDWPADASQLENMHAMTWQKLLQTTNQVNGFSVADEDLEDNSGN